MIRDLYYLGVYQSDGPIPATDAYAIAAAVRFWYLIPPDQRR